MHPFPSSCHHPILTEVAAVSASWGGGESLQRPPEGLELCPPQCPDSRTPPHSHLSSPPCPKSSVALCRGAVLRAVHPVMVWEAGMFCCHQKPALSGAALLQSSAPARCCQQWCSGGFCSTVWVGGPKSHILVSLLSAWPWGRTGHSVGFPVHPVWSVLVPVQCPPLGTPCALCFQAAPAWPEEQRNVLQLRGCEPGLGLPPDPAFLLLACCGRNQLLRAEVGLLLWGCHQGWVTRRGPRGKEGAVLCSGAAGPWVWAGLWLGHLGQPLSKG